MKYLWVTWTSNLIADAVKELVHNSKKTTVTKVIKPWSLGLINLNERLEK
jgi:hypothetical protein